MAIRLETRAYDILAVKKQREAAEIAAQSNAIVNQLFPSEVRDRLFNEPHFRPGAACAG